MWYDQGRRGRKGHTTESDKEIGDVQYVRRIAHSEMIHLV